MKWLAAAVLGAQFIAAGALTGVGVTTTITSPTQSSSYDNGTLGTLMISGTTLSDRPVNSCTWVLDTGGSGTATGTTSWSATISLSVGASAFTVTCTNDAGTTGQDTLNLIRTSPTITSLSTSSGPVGTSVTITGTNYGATQGTGVVTFNGTTATVSSWGATSISTTVPTGATTGNVVVTKDGLTSNGISFTVSSGSTANPIAGPRLAGGDATLPNSYWAAAGATIETGRVTCATLASSSTAAQINSALASCASAHQLPAAGGMVVLGAGNFTISSALKLPSNVTLRGQGATSTTLTITTNTGSTWPFYRFGTNAGGYIETTWGCCIGSDTQPTTSGVRSGNTRTWSGTNGVAGVFTQGATVVNVSTAPTGLAVGDELILWQNEDTTAPNAGIWFSTVSGTVWQGSYYGGTVGGPLEQRTTVTAINGTAITISPGVLFSTGHFRTSLNPRVGWLAQSDLVRSVGIENLRIDSRTSSVHPINCTICFGLVKNGWITGVVVQPRFLTGLTTMDSNDYVIKVLDSMNVTVKDNWITQSSGGGHYTATTYAISTSSSSNLLIQNNIMDQAQQAITIEVASHGNVYAYNYDRFVDGEGGLEHHEVGASYNLIEGNEFYKTTADLFHGNTNVETMFRNHFQARGPDLWSFHRWYNLVGNLVNQVNDSVGQGLVYKTRNVDTTKYNRWSGYVFRLGYPQEQASSATACNPGCVAQDSVAWQSAMIWGNYGTNAGTHFDAADVPVSDPVLPNPLPSTNNLPSSYYLASKPAWFGSAAFPLDGPDVTGGDITGMGGHANKSPARRCYEAAGGNIANFTAANCPYLGL